MFSTGVCVCVCVCVRVCYVVIYVCITGILNVVFAPCIGVQSTYNVCLICMHACVCTYVHAHTYGIYVCERYGLIMY